MMNVLQRLRRSSALVLRGRFASTSSPEPKFSQSAAFQGKRPGGSFEFKPFVLDYYQTDAFKNKRLLFFSLSFAAFVAYFGFLREPSDLDEVWNAPAHVLTSNLERKMIREQIAKAKKEGKPTDFLEAELAYVDVKEEAMKIEYERQLKQRQHK